MTEREETECPNCKGVAYRLIVRLPESPRGDWISFWTCNACDITFDNAEQWNDHARYWMVRQSELFPKPKWIERRVESPKGVKRPT
jgi:hypothetical protein